MKRVVLCIMDGVGLRQETLGNAVRAANTKNLNSLVKSYPVSLLGASGTSVGLPKDQMGNSEVGHTNIGAGRVVYQSLERINKGFRDGSIYNNENLTEAIEYVKNNNSRLHILGLLSNGGIHSHIDHLFSLLELCKEKKVNKIYLHLFTDGRDTNPKSGINFIHALMLKIKSLKMEKNVTIASVAGRYYAMDRDNNWDRIRKEYDVIVNGLGRLNPDIIEYMKNSYNEGVTDEFIKPMLINRDGIICNNDRLITFNFRPDRLRELFTAITNPEFNEFPHKTFKNIKLVTMMPVSDKVICTNIFPLEKISNTLGEYLSGYGVRQLRIAETEKYAHVTYFFDGGEEKDLPNCDRVLIPSPKVATYDLKPEMSAYEITEKLLSIMNNYGFIVVNFANGDMVGHTGVFDAAKRAVEVVDDCLGKIYHKAIELGFTLVITADHGNCDYMLDENNNPVTTHSMSLVPLIITDSSIKLRNGRLADIAPTILKLMNIEKPNDMTGNSLIL